MKSLFFITIAMLCLISCNKKYDDVPASPFAGNWRGGYTGTGDNGTWEFTVSASGDAKGTATSLTFGQAYDATGTVSNTGQVSIGVVLSGAVFTGNFTGNTASGTWVNNSKTPPYSGNWSGSKY